MFFFIVSLHLGYLLKSDLASLFYHTLKEITTKFFTIKKATKTIALNFI